MSDFRKISNKHFKLNKISTSEALSLYFSDRLSLKELQMHMKIEYGRNTIDKLRKTKSRAFYRKI